MVGSRRAVLVPGRRYGPTAPLTAAVGASASSTVLVGKSLASHAAVVANEHRTPAIRLTPLLHEAAIVTALRAAPAPFLLVGGTADPEWDGALARTLTPHVLDIAGADHG